MKSINIIDKVFSMSNQNKMLKEISNSSNVEKMDEFKKIYIIPILKERNIEMPSDDYLIDNWKKITDYNMGFIKKWMDGYIKKELEQKYNYLNYQKFMPNMSRFSSKIYDIEEEDKKILGVKFADFIYKLTTFEVKSNEYLREYIIPTLENEKNIIFNMYSNDENVKLITQKTIDLFLKYIHEQGSMTFHDFDFEDNNFEDIQLLYNYFNFLYINNKELKKELAINLCKTFIENYEKIDFTKKSSHNVKYLYDYVPKELLEYF